MLRWGGASLATSALVAAGAANFSAAEAVMSSYVTEYERTAAAQLADDVLRPMAETMDGYAGIYQAPDGRVVMRFTAITAADRAKLVDAAGDTLFEIDEGASATYAHLVDAVDRIWARDVRGIPEGLHTIAVDEIANRLELRFASLSGDAGSAAGRLSDALGVEVVFARAPRSENTQTCDSSGRSYCFDPMRAGTLVHNNAGNCTMGFHVQLTTNPALKGFVSAGHCQYGSSVSFHMDVFGFVGAMWTGTNKYTVDLGADFMVVHLPSAAQASRRIYDTTRIVVLSGNPVTGEAICVSPGKTDELNNSGIDCGTVRNANISWVNDIGLIMRGADADGLAVTYGDSGSPIYRNYGTTGATAVGVLNKIGGEFARLQDVLDLTGFSIH